MQKSSLLSVSKRFIQIADAIIHQVVELLYASVDVVDPYGVVVASNEPQRIGEMLERDLSDRPFNSFLRVPLRHHSEEGEVIVGNPQTQETISPRLAQALVEMVIHQTMSQNHFSGQHELKNQLINDLLHGRILDEANVLHRAKQLGMDLTPPRAVILIDAAGYVLSRTSEAHPHRDLEHHRRAQVVISSIVSFFHLPNDTICADLGQGEIVVLKASDTKNLDLWANREEILENNSSSWANLAALKRAADALLLRLRSDTGMAINVGIGRYHPGIEGLARSYEDAHAALSLGRRFQGNNRVHCLGELGIAAFVGVADEETKIDLAKYLLSPLDHEPELLHTLNVFFTESCCLSSTAKRLLIHRNTLSYRLDKIASLTGLEPRKFDDAVQMRLSLVLRSLQSVA